VLLCRRPAPSRWWPPSTRRRTRSGPAASTLDRRDADLLVCGSRGCGPLRRVLLGGVSSRLLRRAACPLMVIPRGTT
jgi:nucleotide-binding universal stress UspA family protein